MILIQTIKIMASFSAFVHFCTKQTGCDKGGLYAIQPRGLRGSPIKIGYSFNLLRRMADWEYNFPEGIDILAVARMNRPNDTHFHKRRALQLAEALMKQQLRRAAAAGGSSQGSSRSLRHLCWRFPQGLGSAGSRDPSSRIFQHMRPHLFV